MGYIQRIWTANPRKEVSKTHHVQIWDSGDLRFERWPDGSETSWKVISRKKTADGFIETLEAMDLWIVPVKPVWKESLPVNVYRAGFSLPGWDVKIIV